jgi:hypothetical protein
MPDPFLSPGQYFSPQQQELEALQRGQPQNLMTQQGMTALPVVISAIQRLLHTGPVYRDAQRIQQLEPQVQQQAAEYQNYLTQNRQGALEQQGAATGLTKEQTAGMEQQRRLNTAAQPSDLARRQIAPWLDIANLNYVGANTGHVNAQTDLTKAETANVPLKGAQIQAETGRATAEGQAATQNAQTMEAYRKSAAMAQILDTIRAAGIPTTEPEFTVDKKGKQQMTGRMLPTALGKQIMQYIQGSLGVPQGEQQGPPAPDAHQMELFNAMKEMQQQRSGIQQPAPLGVAGQAPPQLGPPLPAQGFGRPMAPPSAEGFVGPDDLQRAYQATLGVLPNVGSSSGAKPTPGILEMIGRVMRGGF